jgi:hypothetical protein
MKTKISRKKERVVKLRNRYSQDIAFTSDNYPSKIIDGKSFIAVFSSLDNRKISYMNKDAFEIVK